jgi:CPA2 family monovalent cation:H+ antiporter-2
MTFNPMLLSLVVLLALAVILSSVLRRLTLPLIPAYMLAGTILGPHGLAWLADSADVQVLSKWGIILLLFTLGLDFSPSRFHETRRQNLSLALSIIIVEACLGSLVVLAVGWPWPLSVFLGFVLATSSTALVARQLGDQQELGQPHGRLTMTLAIFQDLLALPLFILAPTWLSHHGMGSSWETFGLTLARGILVAGLLLIGGRPLVEWLFREVTKRKASELFTLSVLLVALASAMVTKSIGLSAVPGAFLAGMVLGETEFRHQVEADIRPFRDVLLGLFFVSVGMLFNPRMLLVYGIWILVGIAAILFFKFVVTAGLCRMFGRDRETAFRTGLVLSPVGEFGLALIAFVSPGDWPHPADGQIILGIIIVSFLIGSLMIRFNRRVVPRATGPDPLSAMLPSPSESSADVPAGFRDHVIICGYGRVGQNLARFLEQNGISYVALDLDLGRVRAARTAGDPVYYGDATDLALLTSVGLSSARALVVAYQDLEISSRILTRVRPVRADLPILVRTRDDAHLAELQQMGATEVIPETLEASLMLSANLLHLLGVPASRILHQIQRVRSDRYALLRSVFRSGEAPVRSPVYAFREELRNLVLTSEAAAVGQTVETMALAELGVVVTALRRDGIVGKQPSPGTELRVGDLLVLYGTPEDLDRAAARLLEGLRPQARPSGASSPSSRNTGA